MISYKPFQKLLIDKGLPKSKVKRDLKLSSATIAKLNGNEYVSLLVIDKLCDYLNCTVSEVIEHMPLTAIDFEVESDD